MFFKKRSPVLKTSLVFDIQKLDALFEKKEIYGSTGENFTASLVHRKGEVDEWGDGTTQKVLEESEDFYFSEGDFTEINTPLRESYFSYCYEELKKFSPASLGRVRLFSRRPLSCSSLHRDLDVRFHLALRSSENALLVFPDHGTFHIPCDGHIYLVDTTRPHFAVNTDPKQDRSHLIFNTYCGFKEKRGEEDKILNAARHIFKQTEKTRGVIAC